MAKFKLQTYWYDQWDKGQPKPPPTTRRRRYLITHAAWRKPDIAPAHPSNPDLTIQFSRN